MNRVWTNLVLGGSGGPLIWDHFLILQKWLNFRQLQHLHLWSKCWFFNLSWPVFIFTFSRNFIMQSTYIRKSATAILLTICMWYWQKLPKFAPLQYLHLWSPRWFFNLWWPVFILTFSRNYKIHFPCIRKSATASLPTLDMWHFQKQHKFAPLQYFHLWSQS